MDKDYVEQRQFEEYKDVVTARFEANNQAHDFIIEKIGSDGQATRKALFYVGGFVSVLTLASMVLSYLGVI